MGIGEILEAGKNVLYVKKFSMAMIMDGVTVRTAALSWMKARARNER